MLTLVLLMMGIGALLGRFTRVFGLILAIITISAVLTVALLVAPSLGGRVSLPATVLVAAVALQVGYGLAVVARAVAAKRFDRAQNQYAAERSKTVDPIPNDLPRSHDGAPLNHP